MALSKTVMLKSGPGALDNIRAVIGESGIPEDERVLLCSPRLAAWLVQTLGKGRPDAARRELGARVQPVGYLEDPKIIVTYRETARKIAPESVQAARA